jgi:hypothetical protein
VARWGKGEATVTRLIDNRHLQRVAADSDTASSLLASAKRHAASARLTVDGDPEASYSLAYDAARKASTALLVHQGLRPTTAGGHLAVVEIMRAQFPGVPGLTSLDRLRRRRNQASTRIPQAMTQSLRKKRKKRSRSRPRASRVRNAY